MAELAFVLKARRTNELKLRLILNYLSNNLICNDLILSLLGRKDIRHCFSCKDGRLQYLCTGSGMMFRLELVERFDGN